MAPGYGVPNALRKVLEIFLASRLPGSDGMGAKSQAIADGDGKTNKRARLVLA